ncbi:MAG: hypothetical protein RL522_2830 [Pseudomonadota bacterium]|jgi:general secretion pathway protein C
MSGSLSGNLQSPLRAGWTAKLVTALLWAVVAGSVVFWGLRLAATRALPSEAAAPVSRLPDPVDPAAVARLLGASAVTAEAGPAVAGTSLVLTGVAAGYSGGGAALIAVDGAPPRPYRVGHRVQNDLWLQSVQGRQARLGPAPQGPTTLTLELPAPPERLPLNTR